MRHNLPSLILAVVEAALALAAPASFANYEGRLGSMADEAVAATRVVLPDAAPAPARLLPVAVPAGVLPPVTSVQIAPIPGVLTAPSSLLTASIPLVHTAPVSMLAIATSPKGPLRPLPASAEIAARLPPPAMSAPRVLVPTMAPPLTPDFSAFATARLVRDGLADGSINPRNPAWRPHLALLLSDPAYALEADTLFAAILSGCAGYDDRARIATAEAWAGGFEGGRFASTIAYCAARQEFTSGNYAAAESRCKRIIAEHPEATDRAMLLMAFAQAQSGDHKRALLTLKGFRKLHPESPAVPEARFMEAWIALQESRNDDAVAILRDIVTETPHAPAAAKATKMLADLEGVK